MAATQLALAVAYPYAGNIGGGGFMVYRKANGEIGGLDFREKAPLAATTDMYLDEHGNVIPEKSTLGVMAVVYRDLLPEFLLCMKNLGVYL